MLKKTFSWRITAVQVTKMLSTNHMFKTFKNRYELTRNSNFPHSIISWIIALKAEKLQHFLQTTSIQLHTNLDYKQKSKVKRATTHISSLTKLCPSMNLYWCAKKIIWFISERRTNIFTTWFLENQQLPL